MTRGKLRLTAVCLGGLIWAISPYKAVEGSITEPQQATVSAEEQLAWEEYLPCVIWDREHKQETVEERTVILVEPQTAKQISGEGTEGTAVDVPGEQPVASTENQEQDMGTQQVDVRPDPVSVGIPEAPLYQVDGEQLDPGVAEYLYKRLCESGIGWFYPYALLIAYQESSFNLLAENVNGRDKGLFQFRIEFHPTLDWRNPYAQVELFVAMMANRANAGKDVYSMISAHNMSDYGPYNQMYVDQVMGHQIELQR